MTNYILRRLLIAIPTILAISLITFIAGYLSPSDPITIMLGDKGDPATVERVKHEYGLDKPLWEQYLSYVWNALHGNLGLSFFYRGWPIADMFKQGLPITARLGLTAALLGVSAGIILGVVSAIKRGTWVDKLAMFISLLGISVPSFVLAPILIIILAMNLHLVPVAGWGKPENYVLPALVLAARPLSLIARITRSSMLDVIRQDYIRTARAKGLGERVVIYKHALKNALIPVLTVTGMTLGDLLTGSFIVETIFNVPGIGRASITSIYQRDYPVIQATTLMYAVTFVMMNLIVDLLYTLVDPRIRYS